MKSIEYNKAICDGQKAEAIIGGCLRGGYVVDNYFYYCGLTYTRVELTECEALRVISMFDM